MVNLLTFVVRPICINRVCGEFVVKMPTFMVTVTTYCSGGEKNEFLKINLNSRTFQISKAMQIAYAYLADVGTMETRAHRWASPVCEYYVENDSAAYART